MEVMTPIKTIGKLSPIPLLYPYQEGLAPVVEETRQRTHVDTNVSSVPALLEAAWPELEALEALKGLELPGSDGEPMENERERIQINLGLESLDYHWRDRQDFYTGGNMFVYYSLRQAFTVIDEEKEPKGPRRAFRGPDMFVVLGVDASYRRQKWVTWEENGRYPDVIFEYLSPRTRRNDFTTKKALYEQTFRTTEYFCFDYLNPEGKDSLLGWRLDEVGHYQPIKPNEDGRLWSEKLQLWVGKWDGTYQRDQTTWLRFYSEEGDLVLYRAEAEAEAREVEAEARAVAEEKAEAEAEARAVAERELERLKALLAEQGITLD